MTISLHTTLGVKVGKEFQSFPPQAHCYYVVLKAFNKAIDSKGLSPANEAIMRKLCSLYAMYWMVQRSGYFMTVSSILQHITLSIYSGNRVIVFCKH